MTALQPCPNEECRRMTCYVNTDFNAQPWTHQVQCECGTCGPIAFRGQIRDTEQNHEHAIRLWNALPRTEPWVSVAERMPLGCDLECYVAFSDGTVVGTLSWHGHDWRWSQDLGPFDVEDNKTATHWKPHTPPRGPVSR